MLLTRAALRPSTPRTIAERKCGDQDVGRIVHGQFAASDPDGFSLRRADARVRVSMSSTEGCAPAHTAVHVYSVKTLVRTKAAGAEPVRAARCSRTLVTAST